MGLSPDTQIQTLHTNNNPLHLRSPSLGTQTQRSILTFRYLRHRVALQKISVPNRDHTHLIRIHQHQRCRTVSYHPHQRQKLTISQYIRHRTTVLGLVNHDLANHDPPRRVPETLASILNEGEVANDSMSINSKLILSLRCKQTRCQTSPLYQHLTFLSRFQPTRKNYYTLKPPTMSYAPRSPISINVPS